MGMCQSFSANDKIMIAIVYIGVGGIIDKRGGDQCGGFGDT